MNFYMVCGEMAEALFRTGKNYPGRETFWQTLFYISTSIYNSHHSFFTYYFMISFEKKKAVAIWQFLINKVMCLKFYSCCEAQPTSDCDEERNQTLRLKFVGK